MKMKNLILIFMLIMGIQMVLADNMAANINVVAQTATTANLPETAYFDESHSYDLYENGNLIGSQTCVQTYYLDQNNNGAIWGTCDVTIASRTTNYKVSCIGSGLSNDSYNIFECYYSNSDSSMQKVMYEHTSETRLNIVSNEIIETINQNANTDMNVAGLGNIKGDTYQINNVGDFIIQGDNLEITNSEQEGIYTGICKGPIDNLICILLKKSDIQNNDNQENGNQGSSSSGGGGGGSSYTPCDPILTPTGNTEIKDNVKIVYVEDSCTGEITSYEEKIKEKVQPIKVQPIIPAVQASENNAEQNVNVQNQGNEVTGLAVADLVKQNPITTGAISIIVLGLLGYGIYLLKNR